MAPVGDLGQELKRVWRSSLSSCEMSSCLRTRSMRVKTENTDAEHAGTRHPKGHGSRQSIPVPATPHAYAGVCLPAFEKHLSASLSTDRHKSIFMPYSHTLKRNSQIPLSIEWLGLERFLTISENPIHLLGINTGHHWDNSRVDFPTHFFFFNRQPGIIERILESDR